MPPFTHQLYNLVDLTEHKWAVERHGFLISHAGLAPQFGIKTPAEIEASPEAMNWIGNPRGGMDPVGGVLWRDADREPLLNIPQVFGHTRGYVRYFNDNTSVCIDVAQRGSDQLAGIWLPDFKVVAVGEDADINMSPPA